MKKVIFSICSVFIFCACSDSFEQLTQQDKIALSVPSVNSLSLKWSEGTINICGEELFTKVKKSFVNEAGLKSKYSIKLSKSGDFYHYGRRFKLTPLNQVAVGNIGIGEYAKDYGVISNKGNLKVLSINDTVQGTYFFSEEVEKEALERDFGITNYRILKFRDLGASELDYRLNVEVESRDSIAQLAYDRLTELVELLKEGDLGDAKKMFDIPYLSKVMVLNSIVSKDTSFYTSDLRMIYDFTFGKFYPIFRPMTKLESSKRNSLGHFVFEKILADQEVKNEIISAFNQLDLELFEKDVETARSMNSKVFDYLKSTEDFVFAKREWAKEIADQKEQLGSSVELGSEELIKKVKGFNYKYDVSDDTLFFPQGVYELREDVEVSEGLVTVISEGTTFLLDSGVNFCVKGDLVIRGTSDAPVQVKNLKDGVPFGCFISISNALVNTVLIDYLNVEGGGSTYYNGRLFTGQFAIYGANVSISNSSFKKSNADDGLNVKYGKVNLDNCVFEDNLADQIDMDFCMVKVNDCSFKPSKIDANGDGVDVSGSYGIVTGSTFTGFLDKGFSIGEFSRVFLKENNLISNSNGIVAKDQSHVYSCNNSFDGNESNYKWYIKKKIFDLPLIHSSVASEVDSVNIVMENDIDEIESRFGRYFLIF